ncbi:MAG: hypothetical protein ACK5PS_13820 [Desulfopila sp.]
MAFCKKPSPAMPIALAASANPVNLVCARALQKVFLQNRDFPPTKSSIACGTCRHIETNLFWQNVLSFSRQNKIFSFDKDLPAPCTPAKTYQAFRAYLYSKRVSTKDAVTKA